MNKINEEKHWLCIIVFSTWVTFTSIESIIFIIFPVFCSICWIFAMQQLTWPSGNTAGSAIAAKVLSRILGHHYRPAGAVWSQRKIILAKTIRTKIRPKKYIYKQLIYQQHICPKNWSKKNNLTLFFDLFPRNHQGPSRSKLPPPPSQPPPWCCGDLRFFIFKWSVVGEKVSCETLDMVVIQIMLWKPQICWGNKVHYHWLCRVAIRDLPQKTCPGKGKCQSNMDSKKLIILLQDPKIYAGTSFLKMVEDAV